MSLRKQLATAKGRLVEIGDEMEAIGQVAQDEGREMSDEDNTQLQALSDEADAITNKIESLNSAVAATEKIAARRAESELITADKPKASAAVAGLPAKAQRIKSDVFSSNYEAYCMGQWLGATLGKNQRAAQFCRDNGVGGFRGQMAEGTDTAGGFAVPDPMMSTIIELVESWGVFRRNARNVPMTSDTLAVPRLDGSCSVYFPSENAAITASELTFGQVNLTAQKPAQLALWSTELNEDAVISMTDLLTRDLARNFAYTEDLSAFLGTGVTGTPTGAGPYTGISAALGEGAKVTAGAGATWATVTLSDFEQMAGKLKEYPGLRPKWYISRFGYWNSMIPLLNALGGTNLTQVEQGGSLQFLGYPVEITQVLAGDGAGADDMVCVLGDLDLGAYLGTRRQVSIRVLSELYAANDQLGIVATMRNDISIHSVGDANEAGAIVGLFLASV